MPKSRVLCIGCEVFSRQLYLYAATSDKYTIDVVLLPRNLHNHPQVLRRLIQEQIDSASQYQNETESAAAVEAGKEPCKSQETGKRRRRGRGGAQAPRMGPYALILVAYGVCGGGTVGLVCRGVPVVIMNRDDCAAVLLGSCAARASECKKCPGTWYCHKGDVERRMQGGSGSGSSLHQIQDIFGSSPGYVSKENEDFLNAEVEKIIHSYSRLLYIKVSKEKEEEEEEKEEEEEEEEVAWARSQAEMNGWTFEMTQGTNELLERLLSGKWAVSTTTATTPILSDFVIMSKNNDETVLIQTGDVMALGVKGAV